MDNWCELDLRERERERLQDLSQYCGAIFQGRKIRSLTTGPEGVAWKGDRSTEILRKVRSSMERKNHSLPSPLLTPLYLVLPPPPKAAIPVLSPPPFAELQPFCLQP